MAHYLNVDQLLEEAANHGDKIPAPHIRALESAAQALAFAIATVRGDVAIIEDASFQSGFGGLCVGFGPVNDGDECPEDFRDYDPSSTWAEGEDEEPPRCTKTGQHRDTGRGVCCDCDAIIETSSAWKA